LEPIRALSDLAAGLRPTTSQAISREEIDMLLEMESEISAGEDRP
jgi:hypothetical protein